MKIILSPAKKMIRDIDSIEPVELPEFIDQTTEILNWLKDKSKEELKTIWKCNDKIRLRCARIRLRRRAGRDDRHEQ